MSNPFAALDILGRWRIARRRNHQRAYYALREAEAMRLQYGDNAIERCEAKLIAPGVTARRARFLRLVLKALDRV